MIRPLRRYHFILWRCLAGTLPLLFVLAIIFRPPSHESHYEAEDFSWKINSTSDSVSVVSISVKNPLKFPSCLVYAKSDARKILVGQLDGVGDYRFDLPLGITRIQLVDAIHQQEITEFLINK